MIFPVVENEPVLRRTHERYLIQVAAACNGKKKETFGIISATLMSQVLHIPDDVCIDYMHEVCAAVLSIMFITYHDFHL
jgi:hypothetical protein